MLSHRVMLVVVLVLLCCAAPPLADARTVVPQTFFGVTVDGPAVAPDGTVGEAPAIRASGTRLIRVAAYWSDLEPQDGKVRFAFFDRVVLDAAQQGLRVLPVVHRTPEWAASKPGLRGSPPVGTSTYARFLTALVKRYGPSGSLWRENPGVRPQVIRQWQVWNEPELDTYWAEADWSTGYVKLLRAAHDALKRADPGSVVVAAGLTNTSWTDLHQMYERGARGTFDVVAVHPYTATVPGVLRILRLVRREMKAAGDASTPLLITEMGWSSGKAYSAFNYGWETTEAGQAARVRQSLPKIAAQRRQLRLAGLFWYTWQTPAIGKGLNSFEFSGLRRQGGDGLPIDKPALLAWKETIGSLTR